VVRITFSRALLTGHLFHFLRSFSPAQTMVEEAVAEVVVAAVAPPAPPAPPPLPPPAVLPGTKVKGTVNWFNVAKGFGASRAGDRWGCRTYRFGWLSNP
jgi:hypothetical protein